MRGGVGCGQACCVVVQDVAMSTAPTDPDRWSDLDAELHRWRQAHPDATFAELEVAVDAHLDALRATVLSELATEAPAEEARCPHCGARLVARGTHTRTLVTRGDQPERSTSKPSSIVAFEAIA